MNQNDIQHKVHKQEGTIAVKSQYTCLCTLLTSVLQFFVSNPYIRLTAIFYLAQLFTLHEPHPLLQKRCLYAPVASKQQIGDSISSNRRNNVHMLS